MRCRFGECGTTREPYPHRTRKSPRVAASHPAPRLVIAVAAFTRIIRPRLKCRQLSRRTAPAATTLLSQRPHRGLHLRGGVPLPLGQNQAQPLCRHLGVLWCSGELARMHVWSGTLPGHNGPSATMP